MLKTQTGNFSIGIRRGGGWQSDLAALLEWAKSEELGVIDIGRKADEISQVREAGLQVGSVDLLEWQPMLSPDAAKRRDSVQKNAEYIRQSVRTRREKILFRSFARDASRPRAENFGYAVESFGALAPSLEAAGGQLVIEGWPGPGALCCTPETYRALFNECASPSIGINYDPSHLLRMGIDPLRFLKEFAPRVGHVHGKDTEILAEDLYEYGTEQPATFKKSPAFGAAAWRYIIPGAGATNWGEVFRILQDNDYQGAVCIELEDKDYNGSEDSEKLGFVRGARFLSAQ